MKEFWNERYAMDEYVYGEAPNAFLKEQLPHFQVGTLLSPAEGEGRNAVFAAKQGWEVCAFDMSETGKMKAERLAEKNKVIVDYQVTTLEDVAYQPEQFDAITLIYAHFPAAKRREYHQKLAGFLKKGGIVILEGFSKNNLAYRERNLNVGGPADIAMLFSIEELKTDFADFDFLVLEETETELNEGDFHVGLASVVRLVAQKK